MSDRIKRRQHLLVGLGLAIAAGLLEVFLYWIGWFN
jgi:hypothetical protein